MNRSYFSQVLVWFLGCLLLGAGSTWPVPTGASETAKANGTELSPRIGGVGGVYFLADPGTLVVELEKCDRNRNSRHTEMRAILVGPDRRVLQEVTIPDAGEPRGSGVGQPRTARLEATVPRPGVYGLNVTVSQDRYGDEIAWAFRSNCPKYLIETSRGHRDERRVEPIVLLDGGRAGDVCFRPRNGAFAIEISDLPKATTESTTEPTTAEPISVFDASDRLVAQFSADRDGRASYMVPADISRDHAPWRLHLPSGQATIHIDGVTRWGSGDPFADLPFWTTVPSAWFPLQEYRWLLTPYGKTVHGEPNQEGELAFEVHNNSARKRTVRLAVEFPKTSWPASLATDRVVVGAKSAATVQLRYRVPAAGETRTCHLRATPESDLELSDFSTYSTLTVKSSAARAEKPLDMPLVLHPYSHENEQFGYLPDYPVDNQVYFDLENRPYVAAGAHISTRREGAWITTDLRHAVRPPAATSKGHSLSLIGSKVAFDHENDVYLLANKDGRATLLHSSDGGLTFDAYPIVPARRGSFDIESFSGHNVPQGPPPILRYTRTASDPKLRWRKINDLELLTAEKTDQGLSFNEPVLVSRKCIGFSAHSGIPSSVVSGGGKIHVTWAEATDPAEKVPGVPTFVATFDRSGKSLGEPALVGYGAPPNDVHNSPTITIDSQGTLHVLAGTHGRPFQYARSLRPNDAHSGWTEAVPVGKELRQTYLGLVCDREDTLHLVFRMWRYNTGPSPYGLHATLAYQRKPAGEPWRAPEILIVSPFSEYSIFYHRLTIDRASRLFLSYDYWSTYWFYRTDHYGNRRALLTSPDSGQTWQLAKAPLSPPRRGAGGVGGEGKAK